jgi:hypothetical protein
MVRLVRVATLVFVVGCGKDCWGSDYESPSTTDCERAGGVSLAQYKSQSICIRREAVIDDRDLTRRR